MTVTKIISGGQTGADIGGLRAAKQLGIATGGWMPKGWHTEAGPRPEYAAEFGMKEYQVAGYPARTKANVLWADGTIVFGTGRGSNLTRSYCDMRGRPMYSVVRTEWREFVKFGGGVTGFVSWLERYNVQILNVAGRRESKAPGIERYVTEFLIRVLKEVKP